MSTLLAAINAMPGITPDTPDTEVWRWGHAQVEFARGAPRDSTVRKLGHVSRNRLIGWGTSTAKVITWPAYVADLGNLLPARALVQGALDIMYRGQGAGGPGADIGDPETQAVLNALQGLGDAVLSAGERSALEAMAAYYVSPFANAGFDPNLGDIAAARRDA